MKTASPTSLTIPHRIILASTSPFRRELMERLTIPFEVAAPDVDESHLPGESPTSIAERLAMDKARSIARRHPTALVIGSDQVAYCGDQIFGKPGNRENATRQLQAMRGKEIIFHTGLCVLNAEEGNEQIVGVPTCVRLRMLSDLEIENYLDREDATQCAGSAKSEGLGISLLEYIRGDDPSALIGLPLISLCRMLRIEGVALP